MRPQRYCAWAIERQYGDAAVSTYDDLPILFATRAEAREYLALRYARLTASPKDWRKPRPVRVTVSIKGRDE